MFVCVCHAITDREIREAVDGGVDHVDQLGELYGVGTCCGSCRPQAEEIIETRLSDGQAYAA